MTGGNGFKAPADDIIKCGKSVGKFNKTAAEIKDKAAAAEVPDNAWGLVGKLTFDEYKNLLEKFKEHMDQIVDGLGKAEKEITACGEEYKNNDKVSAESLQKILDDFGKVGKR